MTMGVEELRARLGRQLDELGVVHTVDGDGDLAVPQGDAVAFVRPLEVDGRAFAHVFAITNVDVELSDELTRFLLTENADLVFGGFEAIEPGRVGLTHTLLADHLQRKELEAALSAVVSTADRYNDEIKARFGGKLFGEP